MIELEGYNRTQRLLCPLEDVLDHLGRSEQHQTQVHDQDHRYLPADTSDGAP